MPKNQWANREVIVLAGMINPDYQGEIGLLPHNRAKEEHVLNTEDPRSLLALPCPVIKVNEKLQQPKPG